MKTYKYSCDNCNYFIETGGPWLFYKAKERKLDLKIMVGQPTFFIEYLLSSLIPA